MISLQIARQLRDAGLQWQPALYDFFAVPDRDMDERIFVISDLLATLEISQGQPVVAFQGASEWALDDLETGELVWLPGEDQLRQALEAALIRQGRPELRLDCGLSGCRCTIQHDGQALTFSARQAGDAYAAALLFLLSAR
jgi:hypothetical protein